MLFQFLAMVQPLSGLGPRTRMSVRLSLLLLPLRKGTLCCEFESIFSFNVYTSSYGGSNGNGKDQAGRYLNDMTDHLKLTRATYKKTSPWVSCFGNTECHWWWSWQLCSLRLVPEEYVPIALLANKVPTWNMLMHSLHCALTHCLLCSWLAQFFQEL